MVRLRTIEETYNPMLAPLGVALAAREFPEVHLPTDGQADPNHTYSTSP